jgi:hypothetical protein
MEAGKKAGIGLPGLWGDHHGSCFAVKLRIVVLFID